MAVQTGEELRQIQAQWEEFGSIACHDLRAPLRALDNLSQWIQEDIGPGAAPQVLENLALMRRRVARMARLLEALGAYAAVGSVATPLTDVDLEALLIELSRVLPKKPAMTLVVSAEIAPFQAAREPLAEVLRQLVDNAVKHHDKDIRSVWVSAKDLGGSVEISVSDDGPGIPLGDQERIFKPCQTLKPKDEVEGSGMGLALVKRILNWHGASVELYSTPGRGSRFVLTWPKGR
jgi:signal transduction histidine kinase